MSAAVLSVIILALLSAFLNGVHDSSNVVSTMISSRAFSARLALTLTALAEFCGPLILGIAVAQTIGKDVVSAGAIDLHVLQATLLSMILWNALTWYLGFPSSSSHALVGGFAGSVVVGAGWQALHIDTIEKILVALFLSPIVGLLFGYLLLKLFVLLCWNATPGINRFFKRSQLLSAAALALSHGSNDGAKSMGIIALALQIGGFARVFTVPMWVILISAGALALGTGLGGMRLIRTMGSKFYRIRPIDGSAAQLASALVIIGASLVGGPVSTTQVVSTAIMGAGAADRANKVRWSVARDIGLAWLFTIPVTGLAGAGIYWALAHIFP